MPADSENFELAYREVCNSYHAIDDFRAKLLGFLPLATGTGIFILLARLNDIQNCTVEMRDFLAAVGSFGFLITLGLFSYEIYGIKKCDALIKVGQQMEASFHLPGQFSDRPQKVANIINKSFAAGIIYPTVLAAWTYFTLASAWPGGNPLIPIFVLICGFAGTLLFDSSLR